MTNGQAHERALGHVKTGQDFLPSTGCDKLPRPCNMAVGETAKISRSCLKTVVETENKTAVPTSKKRKGAASSSSPTTEIRQPFLQVPLGPQEELYQILWARPLGVGHCIDWAVLEQIHLADAVRALLTTNP
ncbi:hypothetical protein PVK06_018980 [Gossypium arboreum]|uniref:Uncharacterized protein n=1 Tax=Gossypium arboreum TaxID=29729 RepID=A0ABR0PID7_GOSAR|nr:hypothetical protein PVK06_018980 [Gossypium arboreum]